MSQSLNELVADVTSLEGREYENVCLTGNLAARSLELCYRRNECGIELKLTVECDLRMLLVCDLDSLCYLGNVVVLCRALGGVGKHRNLRLTAHEGLEGLCGKVSDLRQLLGIEISVYCAVSEYEEAVAVDLLTELTVWNLHKEETGNGLDAWLGLQKLKCRTNGVTGGVACAGYGTVCITALTHKACIVHVILRHLLLCLLRGEALLRTKLNELVDVLLTVRICKRINDGCTGEVIACTVLLDLLRSTDDHEVRDALL